jgi:hypothetical protein
MVTLRNNAGLVAQSAAEFKVPTILTTVAEKSLRPHVRRNQGRFPAGRDRPHSMNTWEDENVIREVNRIARGRIVFGGLDLGLHRRPKAVALEQGFEAYVIADASANDLRRGP